jgi:hypothetical protein
MCHRFSFFGLSFNNRASYTDGVLDAAKYGSFYVLCSNNHRSVSNVFMKKYVRHLAIKLFLKSHGSLPMFLQVS